MRWRESRYTVASRLFYGMAACLCSVLLMTPVLAVLGLVVGGALLTSVLSGTRGQADRWVIEAIEDTLKVFPGPTWLLIGALALVYATCLLIVLTAAWIMALVLVRFSWGLEWTSRARATRNWLAAAAGCIAPVLMAAVLLVGTGWAPVLGPLLLLLALLIVVPVNVLIAVHHLIELSSIIAGYVGVGGIRRSTRRARRFLHGWSWPLLGILMLLLVASMAKGLGPSGLLLGLIGVAYVVSAVLGIACLASVVIMLCRTGAALGRAALEEPRGRPYVSMPYFTPPRPKEDRHRESRSEG